MVTKDDKKLRNNAEGHRGRMHEKFSEIGFKGWSEKEVLEYMLYYVHTRCDTKPMASALLNTCGDSIVELLRSPNLESLHRDIDGVGEKSVHFMKVLKEFLDYYRRKELKYEPIKFTPSRIMDIIEHIEFDPAREDLALVCLDENMNVRTILNMTEKSSYTSSAASISAIAQAVTRHNAKGIVLVHNHPNGVLSPSVQDIVSTTKLEVTLGTHAVLIVDHFIVCGDRAMSILDGQVYTRESTEDK